MGDKLYSKEDVRTSLGGTICLYQGRPVNVQVHQEDPENIVRLNFVGEAKKFTADYTKPEFSYGIIPLGYVNYGDTAYYLSRDPRRTTKQGLSLDALSCNVRSIDLSYIVYSLSFADCVAGNYPSIETCLKSAEEGTSKAFHRRFAINIIRGLYSLDYRGESIGVKYDLDSPWLMKKGPKRLVLEKILEQEGIKC